MEIRQAVWDDLCEIMEIYAHARKFMAQSGNPTQWGKTYPPLEMVKQDIKERKCHICVEDGRILCVFYFAREEDPAYRVIREGCWLDDEPYGVIHRIASAEGVRGAAACCVDWAYGQTGNIRIDTHDDNKPMQRFLQKMGFQYCGRITLADGSPRIAFQKI